MLDRLYRVRIAGTSIAPSAVMDLVSDRLNDASPEMAKFRKIRGAHRVLGQSGRPGSLARA